MEKVSEILERQEPHFRKISPDCTVRDALSRMSTQNADYLIVVDENENFLGLLTEHDIASRSIFAKRPLTKTRVKEMMNTRLPFAEASDTVEQCMRVMGRHNIRYLPVFDNFVFFGVLSSDDILKEAVSVGTDIFDDGEKII
jgi:CBS domain-containing protein